MRPRRVLAAWALLPLLCFVLEAAARTAAEVDGPPYSPADSMKTMRIVEGFRIELVASEPEVQSPVALDIDEDGRLFVVEMPGYPLDVSPTGKVKLLEDREPTGERPLRRRMRGSHKTTRNRAATGDHVLSLGLMHYENIECRTASFWRLRRPRRDGNSRILSGEVRG